MATFADQHWVGAAMLQLIFTYAQRISTQRGAFVEFEDRDTTRENERCPLMHIALL